MHNQNNSPWNDTLIEDLTRMWNDEGWSASRIAGALGCSRNAVIGKARRLGLNRRGSPIKRTEGPKRKRPSRAKPGAKKAWRSAMSKLLPAGGQLPTTPLPKFVPSAQLLAMAQRAGGRHVLCQWIEGEPTASDECKCLRPVVPGLPFCPGHAQRCYRIAA